MPSPDPRDVAFGPYAAPATVRLPPGTGRRATIAVDPGEGAGEVPLSIVARTDGPNARTERFSLYPPGRPASFLMRVPDGAGELSIAVDDGQAGAADRRPVTIRIAIRNARN